jgi:hypothetical protein
MSITAIKRKQQGRALEMRNFRGQSGTNYLVIRTLDGSYHCFAEAEAKAVARDCGSTHTGNTRQHWHSLWGMA